jgi:hypothetical protein
MKTKIAEVFSWFYQSYISTFALWGAASNPACQLASGHQLNKFVSLVDQKLLFMGYWYHSCHSIDSRHTDSQMFGRQEASTQ